MCNKALNLFAAVGMYDLEKKKPVLSPQIIEKTNDIDQLGVCELFNGSLYQCVY